MSSKVVVKLTTAATFVAPRRNMGEALPIRVACVGDSITEGSGASSLDKSYPGLLQAELGTEVYRVENFGHAGSTLTESSKWYQETEEFDDAYESDPDIVIIGLGTNDAKEALWRRKSDPGGDYVDAYVDFVELFRALPSSPEVILLVPILQLEPDEGEWPDPDIINEELPPYVEHAGELLGAPVVDLQVVFSPSDDDVARGYFADPDLYDDAIHPNDAGYVAMTPLIARAVRNLPYQPSFCPTSTPKPSATPTTAMPTTAMPSYSPSTYHPTPAPTYEPTRHPTTRAPSLSLAPTTTRPSPAPSPKPTVSPTTAAPTTAAPTARPSAPPTPLPSTLPSPSPSTLSPTPLPTELPTSAPSELPSTPPSPVPSLPQPTTETFVPTPAPTSSPTQPTSLPTPLPSPLPSPQPTALPSPSPTTLDPTTQPSSCPSISTPPSVQKSEPPAPTAFPSGPTPVPSPAVAAPSSKYAKSTDSAMLVLVLIVLACFFVVALIFAVCLKRNLATRDAKIDLHNPDGVDAAAAAGEGKETDEDVDASTKEPLVEEDVKEDM